MNFGEQLREVRLRQNISQEKLSELTGISTRSIHAYEHSKIIPKTEKIITIAKALNVPVGKLMQPISVSHNEESCENCAQECIIRSFSNVCTVKDPAVKARIMKTMGDLIAYFFDDNIPSCEKDKLFLFITEQYLKTKQEVLYPEKRRAKKRIIRSANEMTQN